MLILFSSPLSKIPSWQGRERVRACPALDAGVRGKSRKLEINYLKIYLSVASYTLDHHSQSKKQESRSTRTAKSGDLLKDGRL